MEGGLWWGGQVGTEGRGQAEAGAARDSWGEELNGRRAPGRFRGDLGSEFGATEGSRKELRGGGGLQRKIMSWALGRAGAGAINPRREGGPPRWLSTCAANSECSSNRLRDLCKAACAGALIGLWRNCPGCWPHFLCSDLVQSSSSLMKSPSQDGVLNVIRTRAKGDFHRKTYTGPEARPPWDQSKMRKDALRVSRATAGEGERWPRSRPSPDLKHTLTPDP